MKRDRRFKNAKWLDIAKKQDTHLIAIKERNLVRSAIRSEMSHVNLGGNSIWFTNTTSIDSDLSCVVIRSSRIRHVVDEYSTEKNAVFVDSIAWCVEIAIIGADINDLGCIVGTEEFCDDQGGVVGCAHSPFGTAFKEGARGRGERLFRG